jgi:hypothetical protein
VEEVEEVEVAGVVEVVEVVEAEAPDDAVSNAAAVRTQAAALH